jgi:hypothetical protein
VVDAQSGQPINRAEVTIPELSIETFSDELGRFKVHSVPGRSRPYEIMVQHPGYENLYDTKALKAGAKIEVTFKLKKKGY